MAKQEAARSSENSCDGVEDSKGNEGPRRDAASPTDTKGKEIDSIPDRA